MDALAATLADQHGVISRRQLIDCGVAPSTIQRMLRRRELARMHPGVYLDHTGTPDWQQRAWAAVLFSWPAALSHESALRAAEGPGRRGRDETTIHVAVARDRNLVPPAGVMLHRTAHLGNRAQWHLGPPRMRYEHAVLDVAADSTADLDAIAVLADACGSRRSTARRLLSAMEERPRQGRRAWLAQILADVAAGTCSVLEHGYLDRVERPHGLPSGRRQSCHRHQGVTTLQDVEYADLGVIVELDGRLFHNSPRQRDRDLDRDLAAAASDAAVTLRLSWGQVFDHPCRTARSVARVLARHGWTGEPRNCPRCGRRDQKCG